MLELLAPAGGKEHFLAAVNAGADAVYFGLKRFSARSSAENFELEELAYYLNYAKTFGVKTYAAMNTLVKDDEREEFLRTVINLYKEGVDGIIMQDIFLGKRIKDALPGIRLHLSTQGGAANAYAAMTAKEYGFSRVVAARETALEDIGEMAQILEVECFAQGALCTAFSGECYASAFIGGNSANRGRCKQPCRMKYSLNGLKADYAICLKDLSLGTDIFKLQRAGVAAIKIEGRMRRAEYVSAAVGYYKKLLSGSPADEEFSALKRSYNRGDYTKGVPNEKCVLSKKTQGHIGEAIGFVKSVLGNRILVKSSLKPEVGDAFKILRAGEERGSAYIKSVERLPSGFIAEYRGNVLKGDEVRITTDVALNRRLLPRRRLPVTVRLSAKAGERLSAVIEGGGRKVSLFGEVSPFAERRPVTPAEFVEVFLKTDKYPFAPEVEVESDGVFIPKSTLNDFRRRLYATFFESMRERRDPKNVDISGILSPAAAVEGRGEAYILAKVPERAGLMVILAPDDYFGAETEKFSRYDGERYLYLLPEFSKRELDSLEGAAKKIGGIYAENISGITLSRKWGVRLFLGTGMNIFNSTSAAEARKTADRLAPSKELKRSEAAFGGAYFTRGNIKLMDIVYCPYGGECRNCPGRDRGTLTDEGGREFVLRRIRAGRCLFEVYNCADLCIESDMPEKLYNFVLYDEKTAEKLSKCDKTEYRKIAPVTAGLDKRGVE